MTGPISVPPSVPWPTFVANFEWNQGEHVAFIGPTGAGKTNTAFWLLELRRFVTIFGTKPKDVSLKKFGDRNGYKVLQEWKNLDAERVPRRILWPDARSLGAAGKQQEVFNVAFDQIFRQGGWTLYLDELWFMCNVLNFTPAVKTYLLQARSLDISLVVATQRPAWVPLEVYDQSTHLFFWRDSDERSLKRLGGISWVNSSTIQHTVANLPKYHVLYINTRSGDMLITRPPAPRKGV